MISVKDVGESGGIPERVRRRKVILIFSLSAAKRDKPLSKMLEKAEKSAHRQVGIPGL